MSYRFLQIEDAGAAQIITLHRPERRNALSTELLLELETATKAATARVLVIASTGPVFSSGHDIAELAAASQSECSALFDLCSRVMLGLQRLPMPVIAEVQGLATAAGLQLTAACDLAVASDDAAFATPGVRIGLFCTTPMVPLVRTIGRKRAFEMLITGDVIDARTALEWGLVNRVVPGERLRETTLQLADRIAGASSATVAFGKAAFYRTCAMHDTEAYDTATAAIIENARHADAREGFSAFLGKRRPVWTGS
jgi:enoyl-CoA hydratase/carnithine racemase